MDKSDLAALDRLLAGARAVVPMHDVYRGTRWDDVIGLRHDVDDNFGSLDTAVRMAAWEHERGYRSTYFMLHTASYWTRTDFPDALARIAAHGHEIGIHANAIAEALLTGGDPHDILHDAIAQLRAWGHLIVGVAPHGDRLCYEACFINDEMFAECARPDQGAPDRELHHGDVTIRLQPVPLADFGLDYETYRLPRGRYLSDSGGQWNIPLEETAGEGQLHILQHPDWWANAF